MQDSSSPPDDIGRERCVVWYVQEITKMSTSSSLSQSKETKGGEVCPPSPALPSSSQSKFPSFQKEED